MPTPQIAKKGFLDPSDTAPCIQTASPRPNLSNLVCTMSTGPEQSHPTWISPETSESASSVANSAQPAASTLESQISPITTTNQSRPSDGNRTLIELLARKQVAEAILQRQQVTKKKVRKPRTCAKCAILGCPGRKAVRNCRNPCQDCRKVDCQGRNSKRPSRPCWHVPD